MALVFSLAHRSAMVLGRSMSGQFEGLTWGKRVGGGRACSTSVSVTIDLSIRTHSGVAKPFLDRKACQQSPLRLK